MRKVTLTTLAVGLCMTANVMAQVPNYVPTNGLVGWWPFNGNANDESGNGNNGTVNGATLTTDRFGNTGKAYSFDGVDDGIEIVNTLLPDFVNSYTINFWCLLDTFLLTENGYTIFDDCDSNQWKGKGRFLANSSFSPFQNTTYGFREFSGNLVEDSISIDDWVNYTCVFNSQNAQLLLYKNGYLVDTSVYAIGSYEPGPRKTQIGRCQSPISYNGIDYFTGHWKGKIDDIGFWNYALTDQEITDLYNANVCYEYVTVTDTLVINTGITGYNPITYMHTLKIWPNPSNDHITIDAGNLATMNGYSIKIEDAQGQQVFQNAVNQQQFYIDITTWGGNGLYFVRIIDPQGNTVDIKKIVLQ